MGSKKKTTTKPTTETTKAPAKARTTKKKGAPAAPPAPEPESPESESEQTPAPDAGVTTLHDVLAAFHTALEQSDKTPTTIASYRAELELAGKTIGLETPVADLTEERVRGYFECDAVTKKKSGKAKSPLSIDKTRRVFRQAVLWAVERGILPNSPLPAMATATAS